VASQGGNPGRFHAPRPPPITRTDFFLTAGRIVNALSTPVAAFTHNRSLKLPDPCNATFMAADARDNIFRPSLFQLVCPFRVGLADTWQTMKSASLPSESFQPTPGILLCRRDDGNISPPFGPAPPTRRTPLRLGGRRLNPVVCLITPAVDRQSIDFRGLKPPRATSRPSWMPRPPSM